MQRDNSPWVEPVKEEPKRKSCVPKRIRHDVYWASWTNDREGEGEVFLARFRGYWELFGTNKRYREELITPVAVVDRP